MPLHRSTRYRLWPWLFVPFIILSVCLGVIFLYPQPQPAQQIFSFRANILGRGSAEFSPDGVFIVAPTERDRLTIWNATSGKPMLTFVGNPTNSWIRDVTFSPDGRTLAIASLRTRLLRAATGKELLVVPPGADNPNDTSGSTDRVVFNPDGSRFATLAPLVAKQRGKLRVYNTSTGELLLTIDTGVQAEAIAISLAYSPDGTRLVTGGQGGIVQVWNAVSGQLMQTLATPPLYVSDVAFSPDGTLIATANDHDLAQLWDARTGRLVRTIRSSPLPVIKRLGVRPHANFRDRTTSVAFSSNGHHLALANTDGSAGIWEVETGQQVFTITGHTDSILSIAFSPDGRRVVTGSEDGTVRVWALNDQK